MKWGLVLAAVGGAFIPSLAVAQDVTSGNGHYIHCKNWMDRSAGGDPFMKGACAGMVNALMLSGPYYPDAGKFCPPSAAPVRQGVRVVVSYMDKHPGEMHENLFILAHKAMREAWPCKE
ncbi:Rap1a/Tai family immunity protein [Microvirga lotononidis]|uniref:Rap1a immunity protein domain-containing protein n=1 Tax=Microvirga lotononidis TaxID=864069 RepID=I4YTA2_9HYPH|nr:Rap1a/Tai family immunity protein [Microvirga lotononidis]EIM27194.1 hypothetical protein MicloDRAFT_00037500 [Microvirga lotononidis]WQO28626.1 Rap1a/Tai family immunity protein [Microvirga lotononidis]